MSAALDGDGATSTREQPVREPGAQALPEQKPLGELVNGVWLKAELLMRQELSLGLADLDERVERLKTELTEQLADFKVELLGKILGLTILFIGILVLTAAVTLLISTVVKPWLAASIVGVPLAATGFLLLRRSITVPKGISAHELVPQRALASIDEDVRTIKEATK